jgi:hypothetical protein
MLGVVSGVLRHVLGPHIEVAIVKDTKDDDGDCDLYH